MNPHFYSQDADAVSQSSLTVTSDVDHYQNLGYRNWNIYQWTIHPCVCPSL